MCYKIIEVKQLTKKYKGNTVINNLTTKIDNDNINVITGYNGVGKTTFIKCLIKFIKYKGSISNIYSFSYMPEKIILPKSIKLIKLLNLLCNINRNNKRYDINYLIKLFKLNIHLNKTIKQLSLGTLKKISLIKTLIEDVDLYIFDEPLNGIDQESINSLNQELKKLKEEGKIIIIVTHNIEPLKLLSYSNLDLANEQTNIN